MSSNLILNNKFLKNIKLLISNKNLKKLHEIISILHPADIATVTNKFTT